LFSIYISIHIQQVYNTESKGNIALMGRGNWNVNGKLQQVLFWGSTHFLRTIYCLFTFMVTINYYKT